jgi:signal transduction histidine kinase
MQDTLDNSDFANQNATNAAQGTLPADPAMAGAGLFDPPARVLVVDDEPRNLEIISAFLEAQGWQVVTAEDGEGALRAAAVMGTEAAGLDVVLLDVRMPEPDGFEVCRQLKNMPASAFVPVVIVSGLKGVQDRITAAAAGADEFLTKPFDPVELVTRVRALVRGKRYHDALQGHAAQLERRVAERTAELERALAKLRGLDRLKSEFIANVSHELRTPLLHVKAYVGLLSDGAMGALTPQQAEGLAVAQRAVARLEHAVDDIVDFSHLDTHQLTLGPVDMTEVCRQAIEAVAEHAARRAVTVRFAPDPTVPPVRGDRAALDRVLRHLLDNAIKFGPAGGTVAVQVARLAGGERVRVAVRDQGPGIAMKDRARIFEVFSLVDGSSTRAGGGLGVGLALVKRLVEAHGTQVVVTGELGHGSTFAFELPVAGKAFATN